MAELVLSRLAVKILHQMGSIRINMPGSWIVSGAFRGVKTELFVIQEVLLDAEMKADEDQNVRDWLKVVGDLLFEADDLVAELSAEELRRRLNGKVRIFFSTSNQLAFEVKMFRKFNKINKKLDIVISSARSAFGVMERRLDFRDRSERERETQSFVLQEEIFGREADKKTVIDLLLSGDESLTIISIVGMGGIGKTTLAKLVYNDYRAQQHFELKMWVHVSKNFDFRVIAMKLLRSAIKEIIPENLSLDQLLGRLVDVISRKRYLLVLDDVWPVTDFRWDEVFGWLSKGALGSSIIVTTRTQFRHYRATVQIHELRALDETDSLDLFLKVACRGGRMMNYLHTIEMGRQIVRKCEGNPFLIKEIGCEFYFKDPETEWQPFIKEDLLKHHEEISKKLDMLNSLAQSEYDLTERHNDYSGRWERKRETHSFVLQEEIFGRHADKQTVMGLLLSGNEFLTIISIVGMGGIGKTALAKLVFNDQIVRQHFELKMWVHVSEKFDFAVIARKLLSSAIGEIIPGDLTLDELLYRLINVIAGKRCLLVLDDMWDECERWDEVLEVVSNGARESSIIVTTRNQSAAVGQHPYSATVQIHELRDLDETDSLDLFLKVACRGGRTMNYLHTREMGRQIVRKCGGNPLAIKAIGSMLYFKDPETEWQPFIENDLPIPQNEDIVLSSLKLSYDNLPSFLKTCFAYCILFPKDYEIDVQTLVNLWISQGFVESIYRNMGSLNAGYEYFVELLQRSFFHEARMDEWGKVTKCKMQNLMHDLAEKVAGEVTVRYSKTDIVKRTRHVSFDHHVDSPWQIPTSLSQAKRMRTIILPCQLGLEVEGRSGTSICDEIVSKFKFVRALDLHNSGIKKVSKSIGKLKHLRYLDLSQNGDIRVLPNSIGRLQYLDTLKLNYCSKLEELPRSIKSLVNLRNLEIGSCCSLTHMPRGLGQLTKLETLSEFVLNKGNGSTSKQCGELGELSELNQLKGELRIKNLRPGEDTGAANLKEKQYLRSLILMWDIDAAVAVAANDTQDISLKGLQPNRDLKELALCAYGGVELPSWLPSLENLVKFSLWGCMKCVHLPSSLNHLPHLKTLVLDDMPDMKFIQSENASTTFFPSLEELRLTNLPNLKGWCATEEEVNVEEMATFHCLSKLIIEDCSELTFMPHFPNLQELLLKRTSWDPFQQSKPTATESSSSSSVDHTSSGSLSKLRTLSIVHMPINGDLNIWHSLKALCSLTFDNVPLVKSLLEGLQELTSLQELRIWRCDSMEEIPEWISNDRSSLRLSIRLCPNLKIAPDRIGAITSLKNVDIEDCPRIAHIEILHKHRLFSESKFQNL